MAEIYKSKFPGQEIDERLELIPELQEGVEAAQQAADGKYTKPASGIPMTDLSDEVREAIEEGGGQADWAQTDTTAPDYIKNKPSIPTHVVRFVQQFLSDSERIQARANIGAGTYTKPSGGIPESDLADDVVPDVSDFITNTVNNLVNYYLKSETYSRSEVQQLIAAIQGVSFVSVASLPTPSADTMGGKIYLVPSANPDEQNVKDEFITIQDGNTYTWEQIGSTAVNLSGYVTTQQLNNALVAYTTTEALTTLLAAKQDTISDLSAIRSGAAAGATAYQKPQTGIPASDLAPGVIPTVPTDVVKYSSQSLTDAQKAQARTNIGAAAASALTALETAIAAKYTKPSSGIPETDLAANVQSALALARTSIQSLVDYYDKTEIDALLAAVSSEQYVDVTTLPTASASTLGKIYLVGPTNGVYDRYYTSYDGTTYSWVGVGTTEINLANYATKEELSQLSQKVDDISTGKYYGYYATSADLPDDATVDGFAYVGSGPTYTIYNCEGGVWTSSGITVNQSPVGNEEDIDQNEDGKLQFANRTYNSLQPNGMGYKILRNDATVSSQVTETNTIFEVRYDFNLGGGSISLPANSVLLFNGGSISNGTLTGNNSSIIGGDYQVFDSITFAGTWKGNLNACWVGASANDDSYDNSAVLQSFFSSYSSVFKTIFFPRGTYWFKTSVTLLSDVRFLTIDGCGSIFAVNISTNDASFIELNIGEYFKIQNVDISNRRQTSSNSISKNTALYLKGTQYFSISDVNIWNFEYGAKIENVYYGGFYGQVSFRYNRVGIIFIGYECNTVEVTNVEFKPCSLSSKSAVCPQESGESDADYELRSARVAVDFHCKTAGVNLSGCVIEGFDYGIRYNYQARSTAGLEPCQAAIENCYFEGNVVYNIYVGSGYVINPDNLANRLTYTPFYCRVSSCVFIDNTNVYFQNVYGSILGCSTTDAYITANSRSVVRVDTMVRYVCGSSSAYVIREGVNLFYPSRSGNEAPFSMRQSVGAHASENSSVLVPAKSFNYDGSIYEANGSGVIRRIQKVFTLTNAVECKLPGTFGQDPIIIDRNNIGYSTRKSGSGAIRYNVIPLQSLFIATTRDDGIELEELLRRWDAGTAYTGYVNQYFLYKVRTVPSDGLVYMENESGVESIVGLGATAYENGSPDSTVKNYLDMGTLCYVWMAYSVLNFQADLVQNCRTYNENLDRSVVNGTTLARYRFKCTTAQRDAIVKRLNAIVYNTTTHKYEIFNGYEWVELTSRYTRYDYIDHGNSIAQRMVVADVPGQTFFNAATGIRYTYEMDKGRTTGKWLGDIGLVDSLTEPNFYDSTTNPVDYATELEVGEMVRYNGNIIRWNGSSFENLDGSAVTP